MNQNQLNLVAKELEDYLNSQFIPYNKVDRVIKLPKGNEFKVEVNEKLFKVKFYKIPTVDCFPILCYIILYFRDETGKVALLNKSIEESILEDIVKSDSVINFIGSVLEANLSELGFVRKDTTDWNSKSSDVLLFTLKAINNSDVHINEKRMRCNEIEPILRNKLVAENFYKGSQYTYNTLIELENIKNKLGLN
jgi:hypothetical protein